MKRHNLFKFMVCSMAWCTIFSLCGCGNSDSNKSFYQPKASTAVSTSEVSYEEMSNTDENSIYVESNNTKITESFSTISTEESSEVSEKTYGIMSFDKAIKIIPEFDKIDTYYTENKCYSDERSYDFVCYARIIKNGNNDSFNWQGKKYSFKIGDLIEIQSKISPENNPDCQEYRVTTYIGDYKMNTGLSISFPPEELEFLEPGYQPKESDNVVISSIDVIEDNSTESSNSSNTESSSDSSNSEWIIKNYVDDFGDRTGEEFLATGTSDGKYTWSGNDYDLSVALIVDKKSAAILLLEYGNSQANNVFTFDNEYTIKIKDSNGNTKTFNGVMYGNGGDRVFIKDYDEFINLLNSGGETKFYMESNISAKYNFTLKLDGFAELYSQI